MFKTLSVGTLHSPQVSDLYSNLLRKIPNDRPVLILFRHADRETGEGTHNAETLLNGNGVENASNLGKTLFKEFPEHMNRTELFSSPVDRCVETATLLFLTSQKEPSKVDYLGATSLARADQTKPAMKYYVEQFNPKDPNAAAELIAKMYAAEAQPEEHGEFLKLFRTPQDALTQLLTSFEWNGDPKLLMGCTHDATIMIVTTKLLGIRTQDEIKTKASVDFLEPIAVWPSDSKEGFKVWVKGEIHMI